MIKKYFIQKFKIVAIFLVIYFGSVIYIHIKYIQIIFLKNEINRMSILWEETWNFLKDFFFNL